MNPIKSLYIPCLEVSVIGQQLIDAFYINEIATVSKVTIVPFLKNLTIYNKAYVNILEWHDTEVSYNFIQRLRNPSREARLVYSDDDWFAMYINDELDDHQCQHLCATTTINYLAIMNDNDYATIPTFKLGKNIDATEWDEIERELNEMKIYQQLEIDLCL
jgi:hypothetical protein